MDGRCETINYKVAYITWQLIQCFAMKSFGLQWRFGVGVQSLDPSAGHPTRDPFNRRSTRRFSHDGSSLDNLKAGIPQRLLPPVCASTTQIPASNSRPARNPQTTAPETPFLGTISNCAYCVLCGVLLARLVPHLVEGTLPTPMDRRNPSSSAWKSRARKQKREILEKHEQALRDLRGFGKDNDVR